MNQMLMMPEEEEEKEERGVGGGEVGDLPLYIFIFIFFFFLILRRLCHIWVNEVRWWILTPHENEIRPPTDIYGTLLTPWTKIITTNDLKFSN